MRLLNVKTLDLEEFVGEPGNGVPPYAILSHTWGQQEISFREMKNEHTALAQREGFQKIVRCCATANSEGHHFVWIDTCCIDKSCSAELSEAINSMFRWYRQATVCYAYLDDVDSSENPADMSSSFCRSRWFTRGWTLQELLAPYEVTFFSKNWREIGTKRSLCGIVSGITKIDERTLKECTWKNASIACRMSWASSRNTTRLEDRAYCLMGLFDVNMPIIYSEGQKAFHRLQLEIMKISDDQSIFAWVPGGSIPKSLGLLANSPKDFEKSYGITECVRTEGNTTSYDVSKQYIQLPTPVLQLCEKQEIHGVGKLQLNPVFFHLDITYKEITTIIHFGSEETWETIVVAILSCKDDFGYVAIPLRRLNSGEFVRFADRNFLWLRTGAKKWRPAQNVLIRALGAQDEDRILLPSGSIKKSHKFLINSLPIEGSSYYISGGYPPNFIAAPGERPTNFEAVARINQAISFVTPIILFFAHEWSADHIPFAIRFDRRGSIGNYTYSICCRTGPSIKDWEGSKLPLPLKDDDKVVDVDAYAQIPLFEDQFLVIRPQNALLQFPTICNCVKLSVETRLPWMRWDRPYLVELRMDDALILVRLAQEYTSMVLVNVDKMRELVSVYLETVLKCEHIKSEGIFNTLVSPSTITSKKRRPVLDHALMAGTLLESIGDRWSS